MKTEIAVLLLVAVCNINAEGFLPAYIKPCKFNAEFETCVRQQIESSLHKFAMGVPELGVPSIDPIKLDDIHIDGNGLKLTFTEAALYGLSDSKLTNFKINLDEETLDLSFKGNLSLRGKYVIDGKILILPIQGSGDGLVKAQNIEVVIKSKLGNAKDSKNHHLKLVNPSYTYTMEKTVFEFKNLFNGNKQLSEVTHKFVNENWKQIMDDIAPPVVKQIVKTAVKAINKFFQKVNTEDIIIGYQERART